MGEAVSTSISRKNAESEQTGDKMEAGYEQWIRLCPYAVLLIVAAAWAVYNLLAPSSWREWAGAGTVQAFIIALYAEMYGFPLTIYFLTSLLPLDIPLVHSSGHLWATLLGYGRGGAAVEMLAGSVFVVAGVLLLIKGWTKLCSHPDDLVTDGIYGFIPHPQYTGIFLVVVGQLIQWLTVFTLALVPVIVSFGIARPAARTWTWICTILDGGARRAA